MTEWKVTDECTQELFFNGLVQDLESIHSTKLDSKRYDEDAIRQELKLRMQNKTEKKLDNHFSAKR